MPGVKGKSGGPRPNAGGKRPGAGRPRRTGNPVANKNVPAITAAAPTGDPVATHGYSETGERAPDAPIGWPFGTKSKAAEPVELSPLDYLLSVIRDEEADRRERIQAASIAAPFVHARLTPAGKKEEKSAAAKKAAATGRFAPTAPPKLVVSNR